MAAYADTEDPIAKLNETTEAADTVDLKSAIEDAGWQVQAVNWIYEQVTGQNLVESLIAPITGDFAKINENAQAWTRVAGALRAIRGNLNDGVAELRQHWEGSGAAAFEGMLTTGWTVALEADAALAEVISKGFEKASQASQKLCSKALDLLKKLINKLIEAACTAWIPVGGWANAVKIVIQCIDIVFAILDIIEAVKQMYEGVVQLIKGVKDAGTALMKLKDVRSVEDLADIADETREAKADITDGATSVQEGASTVGQGVKEIGSSAKDIRDTAGSSGESNSSSSGSSGDSSARRSSSGSASGSSAGSSSRAASAAGSSSDGNGAGSGSGYQTAMSGNL